MTRDDIDHRLADLTAASAQIGAELLGFELDSTRELLDQLTLDGRSAARWATASALVLRLWEWHAVLDAGLGQAAALRGTRSRLRSDQQVRLDAFLDERSLEIIHTNGPAAFAQTAAVSPSELVERIQRGIADVRAAIAEFDQAAATFGPRLSAVEELSAEIQGLAEDLGEPAAALESERRQVARRLAMFRRDPLAVDEAEVAALEASLERSKTDLLRLQELRRGIEHRLAAARCALEDLRLRRREAEEARDAAARKIAGAGHSAIPEVEGLSSEIESFAVLADAGAWRQLDDAMQQWQRSADHAAGDLARVIDQNRGPILVRNELRGRLAAYRVKAGRLDLLEDAGFVAAAERAHEALYTAPTDLAKAERLVRRVGEEVAGMSACEVAG
jgi:hypothetical protein